MPTTILFRSFIYRRYPQSKHEQSRNYYVNKAGGKRRMLHQEVWKSVHGSIPKGYVIHHRDFNPLNNRLENLQLMTKAAHGKLHRRVTWSKKPTVSARCGGCYEPFRAKASWQKYCSFKCKKSVNNRDAYEKILKKSNS